MNINELEQENINRLAKGPDGAFLISFYKRLITHYADVRQITDLTTEQVKARQLACQILEEELVKRFTINRNSSGKQIITEEYE